MKTVQQFFGTVNEKKESQQLGRRSIVNTAQRRDVWNNRRRFGY